MTNITRHPLLQQAYEVCLAIEECGASVELTNAVTKASTLLRDLDKILPDAGGMSFGQAINELKSGKRVTRAGWNGAGMWLEYRPANGVDLAFIRLSYPVHSKAYPDGARVSWAPSQTDMLANDWAIHQ